MINTIKLFTGLLLACGIIISCNKNVDDETEGRNYLKIGDTEYDLSAGILENYGTDDDNWFHYGYNTDLTLYSRGLSFQKDEYDDWDFYGRGHLVYFEMFSSTGIVLDNSDYEFAMAQPYPIGSIAYGEYWVNYSSENEDYDEGTVEDDVISGKVSITKSGSVYKIRINCVGRSGERITGFYEGTLRYFDRF